MSHHRLFARLVKHAPKIITLAFLSPSLSVAQTDTHNFADESLWTEVVKRFNETETLAERQAHFSKAYQLLNQKCDFAFTEQSESRQLLEEAEYWEANYGIELRGGLTSGDIDSGDVDEGGRTYLELSWDVLDNGYKEFEYRAADLKRRAALENLANDLSNTAYEYRCRGYQIRNSFTALEAALSSNKLSLMESIYQIENQAYFNGGAYLDELLISEEAIVQLSRRLERLNNLSTLNKDSFDIIHPPTIDINIESLVNAVEDDPRFKSLLGLERQRAASINPYQNGKRLRFFLRKEFDVLASNRDETVAGVRFSVPIVFADRPNYQRKLNQLDNEYNIDQWQRIQRVRDSYNSFQNQLDQVITQQYRYLRSKEKMNRVINRRHLDEPMLISAVMARLINYMDASIELVNTKRELYKRANAVFLSARVPFSADFIGQVPVTIKNYRSRPFSRAAYIWSRTFNQTDNNRILLVSKTQGYDRLYLSYSQNIDLTKLEQFLVEAENSGLKVELMISDNALFQPNNHVKAASKVAALSRLANAIHLDIEPQATSEYDDNRLKYQQDYLQMLSVIRQQLPDIQLTAALPFHWELDTYAAAHTFLDKIVIMNYENNKADTLTRRMKRILTQVPLEKLSMAVRPKDFASPFQLEEVLAVVNQASGINDFAFHKFAEVIELKEVNQ